MIVPSIDIQGGSTVQLIGGEQKALDAGDPLVVAERFARAGEIAVIDLDAAMGKGDNEAQIRALVERFPCRVGGISGGGARICGPSAGDRPSDSEREPIRTARDTFPSGDSRSA